MNDDKWYRNEQVWMTIIIVFIAVSFSLVFLQSKNEEEEVAIAPIAEEVVTESGEVKFPTRDIPGAFDFKDIDRPPDSKIIWKNSGEIAGLNTKTIKYVSKSSPKQLRQYYTSRLLDKYYIERDQLLTRDGDGWVGMYKDKETDEILAIFSTPRFIGPPPGSPENPTEVSIVKVTIP